MLDWIALVSEPLSMTEAERFVVDPAAGGICIFAGTTRAETSVDGHELIALDYEAYGDMAIRQLKELIAAARERWPILKLAILHRIGRVAVGEPSVVIAVSCAHRKEAFESCRFLIDELKRDVTIWKKEVWADGKGTWVH